MPVEIIIKQIFVLIILALVGVIGAKRGIIKPEMREGLSKIVFNLTLPFLIVTNVSSIDIDKSHLLDWGVIILIAFISILFSILLGYITQRMLKLEKDKQTIHILHTAFTNAVFLGFPILDMLFPNGEGILYGILYFLTQNTSMWTLGVYMLDKEKKHKGIKSLKKLLNPNTISFFIGILMFLLNIKLPDYIHGAFSGLGKTTIYLAMLYTGAVLASIKLKDIFTEKSSFILSFNRLIVGPIVFIFLMYGFFELIPFKISNIAKTVIILEMAMPCQTLIIILSPQYNQNSFYAIRNFAISTIASIVTLPFIYYLTQLIFR